MTADEHNGLYILGVWQHRIVASFKTITAKCENDEWKLSSPFIFCMMGYKHRHGLHFPCSLLLCGDFQCKELRRRWLEAPAGVVGTSSVKLEGAKRNSPLNANMGFVRQTKLFFTHKPLAMQNNRIGGHSYQNLIRRSGLSPKSLVITGFFGFFKLFPLDED